MLLALEIQVMAMHMAEVMMSMLLKVMDMKKLVMEMSTQALSYLHRRLTCGTITLLDKVTVGE
jgi:hypothetical protein